MTNTTPAPNAASRLAARALLAVGAGAFAAASALAQVTGGPPRPTTPDEPPVILYYAVFAVLTLFTIGASLIPSKRGHLD